jgi:hypothetical protein
LKKRSPTIAAGLLGDSKTSKPKGSHHMADENKAADANRAADTKRAMDEKKKNDEKYLAESRATTEERVAKAYEIETPTPTQEENDAAKLSALGQTPEPPPEGVTGAAQPTQMGQQPQKRNVEANQPSGGYNTRSTETKKD